jgi:hypothetical protein
MMNYNYKWGALSPNDPSQVPLKYFTQAEAQRHADHMNGMIETWEDNFDEFWNKEHWKVKPEQWVVKELE